MRKLVKRRPSAAMVVALVALVAALGGSAYAAGQINGNAIQKQSIGGGKLKQKTLTGYQINVNKLGTVPKAARATNTLWVVVNNPAGPGNATIARASDPNISVVEGGGAVNVILPVAAGLCADVAGRNNAGTTTPSSGYVQTNIAPANPNAIEVHTRDKNGGNEDADFHLLVVC
jgi:hypothetical protein